MALSQIQCLDDNHVNPRNHESKPDFLYCENQRLALEVLLQDGREAFFKFLEARGLRGFLSDPELETLVGTVEPYDPGSELYLEGAEDDEPPLSLHYWPDLSDMSIPQMDLGWPDCDAYRGVTRTTMYSQPPLDGQPHIKEIVRKMIAQAQKVIAVVMDVFTDVDIFRDLLDAGFKRKISVYILLERTTLPHFLSMCQRANMHPGHLKHLRVRCTEGLEFYSRSSTKVRGRLGHRFMFIDGDKAVSGSYSFTWMSSRLERNLVTVVTGQAVKAFDSLFRFLYATSSLADLRQVSMDAEPEPEPIPQPAAVAPPSAALARKLYNPKYALVALGNPSPSPPPEPTKDTPDPEVPDTKRRRRRRASKEAIEEGPPVHPGLLNLEKACLISYLPAWPEPDPASDVIGFINIRDSKKPTQVHLQRSEMFETSQAIRFRSPFTGPERTLPEVAQPRQQTAKHEEMNELRPVEDKTKAEESEVDRAQPTRLESKPEAPKQNSPAPRPKSGSDKDKTLNTGNKLPSNTPTNQDASHQSSSKVSPPDITRPSHPTQTITTNNPKPDSQPGSNTKTETSLNMQRNADVYRTHTLESYSTQTAHLYGPTDSNTQTKTVLPHTDSHTQTQNSTEMTPNCQTPTLNSHVFPSSTSASTSVSQNNQISVTASTTTPACAPSSSVSSSSATLSPPLPSSSAPPVPKPRTIQLVIKDGVTSDRQKLPDVSVVRTPETSTGRLVVHNEPAAVATVVQTSPEKEPETVPDQQNKSGAQKDAENSGNVGDAPQQKPTSQETKKEEAVGLRDDRAGVQLVAGTNLKAQSDVLITDAPKEESVNIVEKIPKDVESKTLTSIDSKLTPQTETKAPEKSPTDCEFAEVPNVISKDVTQRRTYHARAHELQRISYCESTPQDIGVLETVDSSKPPTPTPVSPTHTSVSSAGDSALSPKAWASTHTPDKSLRLHFPDTPDLHSPTPERESRTLTALIRTPTPDGFLPRTPTPDSRTHTPDPRSFTPDPRSFTPDFRTPTSDVSDGYVSALSTASEDYYECSDSPSHEPVFDRAAYRNHGTTEDHVSLTHTNIPNATTTTPTSPAYINDDTPAAMSGATDTNTSNSETQSLSGSASVSSLSSLLENKVEEETSNEENGREEDEKGKEVNTEERRSSEEAKRTADHFIQGKDSTEMVEKNKEAQPQAPKRKRVQSAAERLVDGGGTPEESANEGAEQKRFSTGDLKPKKVSAAGERPEKDKAVNRAASVPGSVERRDRPRSAKESEGQKVLCTPPRPRRGQQQDSRAPSPSRPSKPSRPLSATQSSLARPGGSRQLNQAESKVLHSSFQGLDNTSSARRPPARPPPPAAAGAVGSAAVRKPTEVLRQPPAAQGKARPGQSLNQHPYPKPQASFLHTHSTLQSRVLPHSQNQTASAQQAQQAHSQEEGKAPFSLTFGRLYSLKGLKDKMSKLPVQSSRGSTSSPVQGRKSKN